jgi:mannose-6-phosphate isomerase-like protein (cupin superfamily)
MEYRPQHLPAAAGDPIASALDRDGFAGPFPLLTRAACDDLLEHLVRPMAPPPMDWLKGRAPTDRIIYQIGAIPTLVARLRPLLGEDIVLWGAYPIEREPGSVHVWHTDVESHGASARVITVWIGVRNAGAQSGLRFIPGSHRYGRSVQEATAALNATRGSITDPLILEAARTDDPAAEIAQPAVADGEMMLFDSRIWHSGFSVHATDTRVALLLQYAAATTTLAIPIVQAGHTWPFQFRTSPPMPVVLVSGSGRSARNRVVPPPPPLATRSAMITTLAHSVALPLAEDPAARWRVYRQFGAPTRTLAHMGCHISVLSAGHSPHPPHIHREEELLIVLDGAVDVELADSAEGAITRRERLEPGKLSYYPATQHHTLRSVGPGPATYLMFKWRAGSAGLPNAMAAGFFSYDATASRTDRRMAQTVLFEGPTDSLGKLQAHLTMLQPGAGYQPHADGYDVAILLLKGEIETVGARLTPLGLVYYSAGELHGMRNVGSEPAVYLVFEFHSPAFVTQVELQRQAAQQRRLRKKRKEERRRGLRGLIRRIRKRLFR